MKRLFILAILTVLLVANLFANEHIKVTSSKEFEHHNHETYEVWYDSENKNPAYVIWDLTNVDAIESDASNNRPSSSFATCGSSAKHTDCVGYDRGHMCPNNDRDWNVEAAKNTFRMCNVCPQSAALNRGIWKKYEKRGHEIAKKNGLVTIICGPIYSSKTNVYLKGVIRIPDAFFKIFYYSNKVECYVFGQDNSIRDSSIEEIENLANIKIDLI